MEVKDIMTREVITVSPETRVGEVARLISDHNFNGVPVIESGRVIGMITENDFMTRDFAKIHIPSLIRIMNDLKISKRAGKDRDDLDSILSADARSIMTKDFVSIGPEDHISELIQIFHDKQVNPVPVVGDNNKLLGIVSKADILNLVGKIREEEIDFLVGK
jgi:CBS domain-containing protein